MDMARDSGEGGATTYATVLAWVTRSKTAEAGSDGFAIGGSATGVGSNVVSGFEAGKAFTNGELPIWDDVLEDIAWATVLPGWVAAWSLFAEFPLSGLSDLKS